MSAPLVSIVMPVRNGIPFLRDCLDSIIEQTYTHWQLHIVDDHSTDDTAQVLQEYADADQRIMTYSNTGTGIIDALRLAYANTRGQLITRMDADDIMPANKLRLMVEGIASTNDLTVVTGNVEYFSESGVGDGYRRYQEWLNGLGKRQSHWQEIYKECVIASPCWMMRRLDFEHIGAFESDTYPEDYDLCFRMYQYGCKVLHIDQTLHLWRDHGARASRNDEHYSDNRFLDIKLNYYQHIEIQPGDLITIIGAGTKGKKIAKCLSKHNISIRWITNNPNKIGHDIYGNVLLGYQPSLLQTSTSKVIVAIANPQEQKEVLKDLPKRKNNIYHCFC